MLVGPIIAVVTHVGVVQRGELVGIVIRTVGLYHTAVARIGPLTIVIVTLAMILVGDVCVTQFPKPALTVLVLLATPMGSPFLGAHLTVV